MKDLVTIGVLARKTGRGEQATFAVRKQGSFFEALNDVAKTLSIRLQFFAPSDVSVRTRTVRGYSLSQGRYIPRTIPLPGVVYDRYFAGRLSRLPRYLRVRRAMEAQGVIFVNSLPASKLAVHNLLKQTHLAPHLPETKPLTSTKSLLEFIDKHPMVYLKPISGARGWGILRVERSGRSTYTYRGHILGQPASGTVRGRRTLANLLRPLTSRTPYLMQQGIDLLQMERGLADVRTVVQKDGEGVWQVTGMAFRVGAPHSVTSNIHTGGTVRPVDEELWGRVTQLALQFAVELERQLGALGELGLDFGVDRSGRIWFIETNTRPGRYIFHLLGDLPTRRVALRRPLEYARFLATRYRRKEDPPWLDQPESPPGCPPAPETGSSST